MKLIAATIAALMFTNVAMANDAEARIAELEHRIHQLEQERQPSANRSAGSRAWCNSQAMVFGVDAQLAEICPHLAK